MQMLKGGKLNNKQGFTLIELSIVLLLLSIFCVLSVPLLNTVAESNIGHSAHRISSMVKFLYNETALTAQQHRLIVDIDHGMCRPQVYKAQQWQDAHGNAASYKLPDNVQIKDVIIDGSGMLTDGTATMVFHPQGWLPETIIHLRQGGGKQLTIRFFPFTGSAEVIDGYQQFD